MLKPVFIAAFSGHRPDGSPGRTDEALEATAAHLRKAFESLQTKAAAVGGELHLISGCAAGADIVACETARAMGIPIHLMLPEPEDGFLQSFDGLEHWIDRSRTILEQVKTDRRCSIRVGGISRTSPDCYAEANAKMLDIADLLLTVWNGKISKSIAGPSYMVEQAEAMSLPRINIHPENPVPDSRNLDLFAKPGGIDSIIFEELKPHLTGKDPDSGSTFADYSIRLGDAAEKSSSGYRRRTAKAILLHALAGFIAAGAAACYHALHVRQDRHSETFSAVLLTVLALFEVLLVGSALYLEFRSKKAGQQRTWLHCRFACELMRGIEAANLFQDPLYPDVRRHDRLWGRFAATCALLVRAETGPLDPGAPDAIRQARDAYVTNRIDDQIQHFREKNEEAHGVSILSAKVVHLAGPVALVVVAFAFVIKLGGAIFHHLEKPGLIENPWAIAFLLLLLPILVPLVASLSPSFQTAFDFKRRSVRYGQLESTLEAAKAKLLKQYALGSIQTTIRQTEQILLSEKIEWLAAQQAGFGH